MREHAPVSVAFEQDSYYYAYVRFFAGFDFYAHNCEYTRT